MTCFLLRLLRTLHHDQEQYYFQIWMPFSSNLFPQHFLKALGKGDIAEILKEKTGLNKKDIELMLTAFSQTVQQEVMLVFESIWKADVTFLREHHLCCKLWLSCSLRIWEVAWMREACLPHWYRTWKVFVRISINDDDFEHKTARKQFYICVKLFMNWLSQSIDRSINIYYHYRY